jgi:hypothetical protein
MKRSVAGAGRSLRRGMLRASEGSTDVDGALRSLLINRGWRLLPDSAAGRMHER